MSRNSVSLQEFHRTERLCALSVLPPVTKLDTPQLSGLCITRTDHQGMTKDAQMRG